MSYLTILKKKSMLNGIAIDEKNVEENSAKILPQCAYVQLLCGNGKMQPLPSKTWLRS